MTSFHVDFTKSILRAFDASLLKLCAALALVPRAGEESTQSPARLLQRPPQATLHSRNGRPSRGSWQAEAGAPLGSGQPTPPYPAPPACQTQRKPKMESREGKGDCMLERWRNHGQKERGVHHQKTGQNGGGGGPKMWTVYIQRPCSLSRPRGSASPSSPSHRNSRTVRKRQIFKRVNWTK